MPQVHTNINHTKWWLASLAWPGLAWPGVAWLAGLTGLAGLADWLVGRLAGWLAGLGWTGLAGLAWLDLVALGLTGCLSS